MVAGIERVGRQRAERAHRAPAELRPERVAAVLDQHDAPLGAQLGQAGAVERVAERVGQDDRAGAVRHGAGHLLE